MRFGAIAAGAVILLCMTATPSLADCTLPGRSIAEGTRVCQGEVVNVCSAGEMLATTLTCKIPPGGEGEIVVALPGHHRETVDAVPISTLIHVKAASYRAGGTAMDLAYRLREMCDRRQTCTVTGDAKLLQGAPRGRGQFNVVYACLSNTGESDTKQVVFAMDAAQTLDCR